MPSKIPLLLEGISWLTIFANLLASPKIQEITPHAYSQCKPDRLL